MTSQVNFERVRTQTNRITSGSFYTDITSSGSMTGNLSIVLPPTAGVNGYGLITNGSGITSWSASGGISTFNFNSNGNVGGASGQNIYFLFFGTSSDAISSRIYPSKVAPITVTQIDVDLSATFGASAEFRIQRNGTTQATFSTTTGGTSSVSVSYTAGDYLNVVLFTTNATTKRNVNVTLTYQ